MPKSPLLSWIGSKPLALVRQDGHVPRLRNPPPHELPDARQFGLREQIVNVLAHKDAVLGEQVVGGLVVRVGDGAVPVDGHDRLGERIEHALEHGVEALFRVDERALPQPDADAVGAGGVNVWMSLHAIWLEMVSEAMGMSLSLKMGAEAHFHSWNQQL